MWPRSETSFSTSARRKQTHRSTTSKASFSNVPLPYLALRRVKEIREQCKKISDSYFNNLEDFIKKKIGKLTSEQSELIVEMDRVNNIIAELRLLLNKLDNNRAFLQSAETVVKLDGDKIEEKVREGITNIQRFKEAHKNSLFV